MEKDNKPTVEPIPRHKYCDTCYFKNNRQKVGNINECTLCYLNAQAVKTNNYKPLPTAKKIA